MSFSKRCDGVGRRDLLRVGGLTAFGLGLGGWLRLRSATAGTIATQPRAKSCILIWLDGGPSHLETFDPKPDAPIEVRGPLSTITTNVPGVQISECLEHTAGIMDKLAVVRSVTSPLGEHNFGTHYMMTGHKPSTALAYPSVGSVVAKVRRDDGVLPPHIAVPHFSRNLRGNGFLSHATAPFSVGGNPDRADFQVHDLDFYQGLDLTRLDRRRQIVNALDAFASAQDAAAAPADPDLERAFGLIASSEAKTAFRLEEEPDDVRNRYGRGGGNSIGQSCLLARRLVERGVPFVTVTSNGWDTHQKLLQLKERYQGDRHAHLPSLDRAFSALIRDLADRGLLQETLVIVMGEFGRTPKINASGGRDHWPNVFSVVMAGAGIPGGQVIGSSDPLGELPQDNPVTPSDLVATTYRLLGIDPELLLHTSDGRPVRVTPDGSQVIPALWG